jgi:hypothetical protein
VALTANVPLGARLISTRIGWEHVFVSVKGRPYTWLRASLQRGDLPGVRSAAIELRQINLADALAIVLLMATDDDPAYERAATRWLARLASERPSIGLQDIRAAVDALQALGGARPAREVLAGLCARYDVGEVIGLPAEGRLSSEREDSQRGRARP